MQKVVRLTLLQLWRYLWPRGLKATKARLVGGFLSMIVAKIFVISTPLFFKHVIDALGQKGVATLPILLIGIYALSRIFAGLFNEIRHGFFTYITERAMREAGVNVFKHLHHLSLHFHLERKTGALTHIVQRGIKAIDSFMSFSTFMLIPTFLEIVFVISVFAALYEWHLAAVAGVSMVFYIFATIKITEWRIQFTRQMNAKETTASGQALDSLLNFETTKYFNNEAHETKRYDTALSAYEKAAIKEKLSLSILNTAQNTITSAGLFGVLVLAYQNFQGNFITLGDFVAINVYLLQLFAPLYTIGFAYREARLALINMENMFDLLNVDSDVKDLPSAKSLALKEGEITFENVSFSYHSRRPILKNISFTLGAKETVAIVGASGGGKSTIAKLLYRFYDVSEGRILIDGQDIHHCTQESVRQAIGVVPQDTVLFNDTIQYNIAYGKPGSSFEEIVEAAKRAHIHTFISHLPEGYQTLVGERGLKLSGGEKQRVAIARTLLKNPSIYIFDEATSALDSHTEKSIQKQLENLSKNHTTLMIAHRLSTIVHAHKIIVLDQGKIMESGTHEELLKQNGLYADLWKKQASAVSSSKKKAHLKNA